MHRARKYLPKCLRSIHCLFPYPIDKELQELQLNSQTMPSWNLQNISLFQTIILWRDMYLWPKQKQISLMCCASERREIIGPVKHFTTGIMVIDEFSKLSGRKHEIRNKARGKEVLVSWMVRSASYGDEGDEWEKEGNQERGVGCAVFKLTCWKIRSRGNSKEKQAHGTAPSTRIPWWETGKKLLAIVPRVGGPKKI